MKYFEIASFLDGDCTVLGGLALSKVFCIIVLLKMRDVFFAAELEFVDSIYRAI